MTTVSAALVKELRERTGAGMMACKTALIDTNGDIEKAIDELRTKGLAKAAKKAFRVASEGLVVSYIHAGGRIGVLVEVNCETDFAAKNENFRQLAYDIAMQIAAMNAEYVSREDVSADALEREKEIIKAQALEEGKPEKIVDKIVEGRIEKFFQEKCLLEQEYIKDSDKKVQDLINESISQIGENINVRRFVRYEVGEGIAKKEEDFATEVMSQIKNN